MDRAVDNSGLAYSKADLIRDNPESITDDGRSVMVDIEIFFAMMAVINAASLVDAMLAAMSDAKSDYSAEAVLFARTFLNPAVGLSTAIKHLDILVEGLPEAELVL
jgi:hypothetical protein